MTGTIKYAPGLQDLTTVLARLNERLLTGSDPWAYGRPVTPSDDDDLPDAPARGIRILTSGTVKYELLDPNGVDRQPFTETFAAKDIIPAGVYKVYQTDTTATMYMGL